ncbi:MAG: hypothetical protein QOG50_2684, partial [Actinomycetota bacterium]|nr:hypothetical protein [Actinomycetota bacterium]
ELLERVLDFVELERLDERSHQFHLDLPGLAPGVAVDAVDAVTWPPE